MRELSLHILDLIENSIRANASVVALTVAENPDQDRLDIVVEDNGCGFSKPAEEAVDPFYTTKNGKKTGLGLSLFRGAAEQAGGSLTIGPSPLGGVAVKATMQLSHIDRMPLGDIAATVSSVVCTNPHLDVWCHLVSSQGEATVRVSDIAREHGIDQRCGLAIARLVSEKVRAGSAALRA